MNWLCDYPGVDRECVRVRDVDIFLEREGEGDGKPLLVVHGGPGGDHRMFHPDLAALAARRRLLLIDLRGHGSSGWPETDEFGWGAEVDSDDLAAVVEETGERPIDVLGYSYGGIVALHLAARHPETVHRLITVSTPVGATMPDIDQRVQADVHTAAMVGAESEEVRFEAYLRFYLERPPSPEKRRTMRLVNEIFRDERTRRLLEAREEADSQETDWSDLLARIRSPGLFVYGALDPIVRGDLLEAAIEPYAHFSPEPFAASRHDPFYDEPERFVDAVTAFLKRKSGLDQA